MDGIQPIENAGRRTAREYRRSVLYYLRSRGVERVTLDAPECIEMMRKFITANPGLWNEDIGR